MLNHFQITVPEQILALFYESSLNHEEEERMTTEIVEVQHRLIDVEENERLRLAREIHDGPLQELHSLDFGLVGLARQLDDTQVQAQLVEMRAVLQNVSRTLRTLCQKLHPPALDPFGLGVVLRSVVQNFQSMNPGIMFNLDLADDKQRLPERVRLALYRIFQHALDNIVLHARATEVSIQFTTDAEQVVLRIEDNGRGFCIPDNWFTFVGQGRVGLVGCKERAEAVGGSIKIISAPEKGVEIIVVVPTLNEVPSEDAMLPQKLLHNTNIHDTILTQTIIRNAATVKQL